MDALGRQLSCLQLYIIIDGLYFALKLDRSAARFQNLGPGRLWYAQALVLWGLELLRGYVRILPLPLLAIVYVVCICV